MTYNQQQGNQLQEWRQNIEYIINKTLEPETKAILEIIEKQIKEELLKADRLPF